jgi:hypoxanthine phosphoribosyltransferase
MPDLTPVLKKEDIDKSVAEIAQRISRDYKNRDLILVGVLKGAFVFLADLIRHLTIPAKVDFVRIASYGSGTSSSGKIRLTQALETDIRGKDVLIVEDIVDTGLSLSSLVDYLRAYAPKSIRICALINKTERRKKQVTVDYVGHDVAQGFLVGYGLDYAEDYRYLPAVYHLRF